MKEEKKKWKKIKDVLSEALYWEAQENSCKTTKEREKYAHEWSFPSLQHQHCKEDNNNNNNIKNPITKKRRKISMLHLIT